MTMCKAENRPYLYGLTEENELVWFRPDCGLWSCPECAVANKNRWALRIEHGVTVYKLRGETFYFMTLTSHENLKTFESTLAVWSDAWPKLYAKMKRQQSELHYASLPEKHKDGRLHMHILINCGFGVKMSRNGRYYSSWLKDNARKSGLGFMADIQPLQNSILAAWYVTKYVSKSLEAGDWPRYLRRVRVSNNWPELPVGLDFEPLEVNYNVAIEKPQFLAILARFEASGYKIRALKIEDKRLLYAD